MLHGKENGLTSDLDWQKMTSNPFHDEDSDWLEEKLDPKYKPQHICRQSSGAK